MRKYALPTTTRLVRWLELWTLIAIYNHRATSRYNYVLSDVGCKLQTMFGRNYISPTQVCQFVTTGYRCTNRAKQFTPDGLKVCCLHFI